jgi:uncharacterized protein with HEPN domain
MRSNKAAMALFDIRDNALYARQFAEGFSFEAFKEDRKTFYAVTRALEIISEAARRLPDDLRDRHPTLPWRAIMGAGNVYRHNYDNVLETYVWGTLHDRLPELVAVVLQEIENA